MLIRKSIVISSNAQVIYLNAIENNYLLKRINEKGIKKYFGEIKGALLYISQKPQTSSRQIYVWFAISPFRWYSTMLQSMLSKSFRKLCLNFDKVYLSI